MPKPQKKNGYEDADFQQVIQEVEQLEAEQREIRAKAAGDCSGLAKKIEDAKKTATKLNIPKRLLSTVLKQRKLEKQLQDLAADVPDEMAELYLDAAGQFSFLKPEKGEGPAMAVARARKTAAEANHEVEQQEGAKVLDGLVTH